MWGGPWVLRYRPPRASLRLRRFATFTERLAHRDLITELLDAALSAEDTATWLARFAGRVPAAPINDVAQALDNPFVTEHGRLQDVQHPGGERFRTVAPPVRSAGVEAPARPGPMLGEHTDEILAHAGIDADERQRLREDGII